MRKSFFVLLFFVVSSTAFNVNAQQSSEASRIRTRESLRLLLEKAGPAVKVSFRQSDKQPFNFVGVMREGLKNLDSLEIVIGVTTNDTIGFRIFPHYKGKYINIDKAKDSLGLMRKLLMLSDRAFLYWGADESGDVFTGYTFTLESGFPEEAIKIVLQSIVNADNFIPDLKPLIDGGTGPAEPH